MSTTVMGIIVGIVISVAVGFGVPLLDKRAKDSARAFSYLATLSGIVLTTVVAFGIETMQQLDHAVPRVKLSMWQNVLADVVAVEALVRDSSASIRAWEEIWEPVRYQMSSIANDAKNGVVRVPSKPRAMVLAGHLIGSARSDVLVTSYVDSKEWWKGNSGDGYSAIRSATGVQMTRIFIVDTETEAEELGPIMDAQCKAGVEVRVALAPTLQPSLRSDFMVIDDAAAAELLLTPDRRFVSAVFYPTAYKARELRQRFSDLSVDARPHKCPK